MEVEPQLEAAAARRVPGDRPERGLEPGLVEDVRVELEDRVAQLRHALREGVVCAAECGMRQRLPGLLELVAGRQQVLDRLVVQGLGERLPLRCSASSASASNRDRLSARRATCSVRRARRSESSTQAAPTQARKPAWVRMKRAASGWLAAGCATAWTTYAEVVTTTAAAVIAGRKRKATATGTRKKASRACEKAPPDRTASALIAAMSTPVAARASPWPTGRRCTHASIPALHAE